MSRFKEIEHWYETLSPESLTRVSDFYAKDLEFKDPFHKINQIDDFQKYFNKMFTHLKKARFVFLESIVDKEGNKASLYWDFHFEVGGKQLCIHGSSKLILNDHGLIQIHHDYWDLATEVYEKIPVLGIAFKGLKGIFG